MDFDGTSHEDPSISYSLLLLLLLFFQSNYCSNLDTLEYGVFLE